MDQTPLAQTHKKINYLCAGFVVVAVFLTYLATVAPTVSFWDCGEYVAVGQSLAVPHPPGNPFYIMISRVFCLFLPFFKEVAYRINLITVIMGAITAMLIYLIIIRTFIGFLGIPDTVSKRIAVYLGGVIGAFFAAFGSTVMFCSVEAEVNGPLLLPITLCTWLALVWAQSKDPRRDRLLVLATYVAFLGIGIHMYSMISLVPVFLFVVLVEPEKLKDWRLWITAPIMGLVMYDISWFIWLGGATALVTLAFSFVRGENQRKWRFCFFLAFFAIIGFSTHIYIPVRSALNPMIDENHPATYQAFVEYLQRKQYGSESMIGRMFWRRGTWGHQFGIEGHMGFGGFFLTQFFHFADTDTEKNFISADAFPVGPIKLLMYLLPAALMFFGWWYIYKRYRNAAILHITLILMTSIFLTLYMNFADGSKSERRDYIEWAKHGKQGPEPVVHREVRVRDYFWVPGFLFYGMWVGLGAGGLMLVFFSNRNRFVRTTLAPIAVVLFAVSPALPFTQNVAQQSRQGNYVPFDYAYNLLMSCDREGIIFTNGDNDTFPLWALQEAYGIRRDVRIINLSLLNTNWYIHQLKDLEPKVPISYSHEEIDRLNHMYNPFERDSRVQLQKTKLNLIIEGRDKRTALRVQDQLVLNIVDANNWQKPVYFAVTVSNDNFMGLEPYLRMEGLAYRILPSPVSNEERIDLARTVFMLDKVYRFRGLGDSRTNLDETTRTLLSNYAASFIQVALTLREPLAAEKTEVEQLTLAKQDSTVSAGLTVKDKLVQKQKDYQDKLALVIGKLDQCVALMPWDWRPRTLRHEFLLRHDRANEAAQRMREALQINPDNVDYQKMLAQALEQAGKKGEATQVLRKVLANDPDPWYATVTLARNFEELKAYDSAIAVLRQFADAHPGDARAASLINKYEAMKQQPTIPNSTAVSPLVPMAPAKQKG